MKIRLIAIALAAAGFGWGFSALVNHADQTVRPNYASMPCDNVSGQGCANVTER